MSKDELDPEEFLNKLDELKKNLPYPEYKKLEAQLPYGLIDDTRKVRRSRRRKRWLVGVFVYLPIFILLVLTAPWLVLIWVMPLVSALLLWFLQWLWARWEEIKGPPVRF